MLQHQTFGPSGQPGALEDPGFFELGQPNNTSDFKHHVAVPGHNLTDYPLQVPCHVHLTSGVLPRCLLSFQSPSLAKARTIQPCPAHCACTMRVLALHLPQRPPWEMCPRFAIWLLSDLESVSKSNPMVPFCVVSGDWGNTPLGACQINICLCCHVGSHGPEKRSAAQGLLQTCTPLCRDTPWRDPQDLSLFLLCLSALRALLQACAY